MLTQSIEKNFLTDLLTTNNAIYRDLLTLIGIYRDLLTLIGNKLIIF